MKALAKGETGGVVESAAEFRRQSDYYRQKATEAHLEMVEAQRLAGIYARFAAVYTTAERITNHNKLEGGYLE